VIEHRLIYRGGGTYQTASRMDLELAERTFHVGEECAGKISHKRSVKQNNTFHVMIQYAHDNQRSGPILPSWEHLKKWLLIEAGHYSERRFNLSGLNEAQAVIAGKALAQCMRSRDDYVAIAYDRHTSELVERTAKSVRFTAVMADDMRELFDRVAHIICDQIMPGMEPDRLVEEAKSSCRRRREAA